MADLSTRAINALTRAGLTPSQAQTLSDEDLLALDGFGTSSLKGLRAQAHPTSGSSTEEPSPPAPAAGRRSPPCLVVDSTYEIGLARQVLEVLLVNRVAGPRDAAAIAFAAASEFCTRARTLQLVPMTEGQDA